MKTGIKVLIGAAAVAAVVSGVGIAKIHKGVDIGTEYTELLDAAFDGNYTITLEDSGTYFSNSRSLIRIPVKYHSYNVEYTDVDGNKRKLRLSDKDFVDTGNRRLIDCVLKRDDFADNEVEFELQLESDKLFKEQMSELIPQYFGDDLKKGDMINNVYTADGYEIDIIPTGLGTDLAVRRSSDSTFYFTDSARSLLTSYVSPDSCNVLAKQDIKSYANTKTSAFEIEIVITDEKKADSEDLKNKAEALLADYAALSDFGGNYGCVIGTKENPGLGIFDEVLFEKYVFDGKEVEGGYVDFYDELKNINGIDLK